MDRFKNLYTIPKTLRFGLKPYKETLANILKSGVLVRDKIRDDERKAMQQLFDKIYKNIIIENLKDLKLDDKYLERYKNSIIKKEKEEINKNIKELKSQVLKIFKNKFFKVTECIKILKCDDSLSNEEKEMIDRFDKFTTYFAGFATNRKHIFKGTTKGSIAFRLIDENLREFNNNVLKIEKLPKELLELLKDKEINLIDDIKHYNNYLTSDGINKYNSIIGGFTKSDGTKIQGINEIINLYKQKSKIKLPKLKSLNKMILLDSESISFRFDTIEDVEELISTIDETINNIELSNDIPLVDTSKEHIYIKYERIGSLPKLTFNTIHDAITKAYDKTYEKRMKNKTYEENRYKDIKEDRYSIMKLLELLKAENIENIDITVNLIDEYKRIIEGYKSHRDKFNDEEWRDIDDIKQSDKILIIKDLLESLKSIQRFLNIFEIVDESIKYDIDFYNWLNENIVKVGPSFNALYNMARNYLTKKHYSTEKYKLNFDEGTIADGWDNNKEKDYLTFILRKFNNDRNDYDYFLGIWNKNLQKEYRTMPLEEKGIFEKMYYKQLQTPHLFLPGTFNSKKWVDEHKVTSEFLSNYKAGKHKKGDNFDKVFLHELINYYKHGLINHENKYQDEFNFKFRDTKEYKSYSEFLEDVSQNNYKVEFNKVSNIDELIKQGKIFVFQIWSKDFSRHSTGKKNLNTIYFESLFSEENLIKRNFKLDGNAELFYRPKSLFYDEKRLKEGHHPEVTKKKNKRPIIKDRRFTEDKFFIHMPIKINRFPKNIQGKELNKLVNDNITDFKHIIGIDRGERHLIYISVVDIATGRIVEQKNLDEIVKSYDKKPVNYLKLLKEKGDTRKRQQKSWDEIENIKELKEGYTSQAINEIRMLQEKYKAIIVLENLNEGFKNSRKKVDHQIYQKFELALIKKLNYLINKEKSETYINGIQLTNYINSVTELGLQSGIVFFIPAWNTSNIDPITGFVNLMYSNDLKYKNKSDTEDFIDTIDKIYFEDNVFKFDINFSKWNNRYEKSRKEWTLSSYGTRIRTFRNKNQNNQWDNEEIDLTKEFLKVLNKDGKIKNEDAESYKQFMFLFKLMLQLRNSISDSNIDYIISPVSDESGNHFDSRYVDNNFPKDADANGAYNIARKGLMIVDNITNKKFKKNGELLYINNEEYLKYIQGFFE